MKAEHYDILGHKIYIRHRISDRNTPSIFFIHGIGDSGRVFYDAINLLSDHNLIIPDLLGFGRSEHVKVNPDYSFSYQLKLIREIISRFDLKDIVLVAHSYGGMLGTLLCGQDNQERIAKFICVEGGISKSSTILSIDALKVLERFENDMEKFGYWIRE